VPQRCESRTTAVRGAGNEWHHPALTPITRRHPFNKILLKGPLVRLVFRRIHAAFDAFAVSAGSSASGVRTPNTAGGVTGRLPVAQLAATMTKLG